MGTASDFDGTKEWRTLCIPYGRLLCPIQKQAREGRIRHGECTVRTHNLRQTADLEPDTTDAVPYSDIRTGPK